MISSVKIKLAIDIDNTIAEFTEHIWRLTERELGLEAGSVPFPTSYDDTGHQFPDALRAQKIIEEKYKGHCTRVIHECQSVPDSALILSTLHAQGHLSAYITKRKSTLSHSTRSWLSKWGYPDLPLIHSTDKVEDMRRIGARCIVEDAPHEARHIAPHAPVALLTRPYNKDVQGENIIRFGSWLNFPLEALIERLEAKEPKRAPSLKNLSCSQNLNNPQPSPEQTLRK